MKFKGDEKGDRNYRILNEQGKPFQAKEGVSSMIKLLGAAIIMVATTWAGFEAARKISARPRQLRQLKVALQSLEAEIMYTHTPLKEAAQKLQKQLPKPLINCLSSFAKRLDSRRDHCERSMG